MLELIITYINFKVKDVFTHFGVSSFQMIVKSPSYQIQSINSNNPILKFYPNEKGKYEFEFIAHGYEPLKTYFIVDENTNLDVDILLKPINMNYFEDVKLMDDEVLIIGFVLDKESLKPLSNVKFQVGNNIVYTDKNGIFRIRLITFSPKEDEGSRLYKVILNRFNMIFSKDGYKTYERKNFILVPGILYMPISLERGDGFVSDDYKHGLVDRIPNEYIIKDGLVSSENGIYDESKIRRMKEDNSINETDVIPLPFFDPPSSIRVGTNCSCTSCSSVSVMSLEDYVGTGLDDEWIASWNAHSLRAGSLAYRAYGSWYVLNPINNNYDICSTTCCQVWLSDQYNSTWNAAVYTSGFAISPSANNVSRAEYSAENNGWDDPNDGLSCVNNCPCGDGQIGSPCAGWPCKSDPVCAGHGCFGHGRGMCQWGTQRWASNGKYWDWMAIHYYSQKGWHISTPMGFLNLSASPTNVSPGQTFTIFVDIYSGTSNPHPQIMLGASLYDGQSWMSDPANDVKINVQPGTHSYTRQFTIPSNTPSKCYDLVVMIWFDVDENNAINSPADLPIDRITKTSYICVQASNLAEKGLNLGDLKILIKQNAISVNGRGELSIYSSDGKKVYFGNIDGIKEIKMKRGVYILKSENHIRSITIY